MVRDSWRRALRAAALASSRHWRLSADGRLQFPDGDGASGGGRAAVGSSAGSRRRLLDTYADSLIFTNHLISKEFQR